MLPVCACAEADNGQHHQRVLSWAPSPTMTPPAHEMVSSRSVSHQSNATRPRHDAGMGGCRNADASDSGSEGISAERPRPIEAADHHRLDRAAVRLFAETRIGKFENVIGNRLMSRQSRRS